MASDYNKRPRKKANPVMEWISDNLRYLLLILIMMILACIIVVCYFNFYGSAAPSKQAEETTAEQTTAAGDTTVTPTVTGQAKTTVTPIPKKTATPTPTATPTATPTPEVEMTENTGDPAALVHNYFEALLNRDASALDGLMDVVLDEDRAEVADNTLTGNYGNVNTYTCSGPEANTYVAIASYTYQYDGFDVDVPALTQFYIITAEDGSLRLVSDITDPTVTEYINQVLQSDDVKTMVSEVQEQYDAVMNENPDLQAYVASLSQ